MRICSVLVLGVALAACVEPVQYGGPIPVRQAGLVGRLESVCGWTAQSVGCEALAAEDDAGADAP